MLMIAATSRKDLRQKPERDKRNVPHVQCLACYNAVPGKMRRGALVSQGHEPIFGDLVSEPSKMCQGAQRAELADFQGFNVM